VEEWLSQQSRLVQSKIHRLAKQCGENPILLVQYLRRCGCQATLDEITDWVECQSVSEQIKNYNDRLQDYAGLDSTGAINRGLCLSTEVMDLMESLIHHLQRNIEDNIRSGEDLTNCINNLVAVGRLMPNVLREVRSSALSLQKFRNDQTLQQGVVQGVARAKSMFMGHETVRDKPDEAKQLDIWDYIEIRTMEDLLNRR
jgi:hypothetical protein